MFSRARSLAIAGLALAALTACSTKDSPTEPTTPPAVSVVGSYTLQSFPSTGSLPFCDGSICITSGALTLQANGRATDVISGTSSGRRLALTYTGTWTGDASRVTIRLVDSDGAPYPTLTGSLTGSTLDLGSRLYRKD